MASWHSPPRYCLAGLPVGYQYKNITDADVNNLLLEDLIIWTNYEIEVAAYNSAGLGVYSSKVTEWTLQGGEWGPWPLLLLLQGLCLWDPVLAQS